MADDIADDPLPSWFFAGFWVRGFAYLIDWILIIIFYIALAFALVYGLTLFSDVHDPAAVAEMKWITKNMEKYADIAGALIFVAYEVICTASPMRATLGKRALGIYVIARRGARVGILRSSWRFIAKYVVFAFFTVLVAAAYYMTFDITRLGNILDYLLHALALSIVALLVPVVWVAFDRRHRGIHDYLAGTAVVYKV